MTIKHEPLDAMEYPRFEGIRTFMRLPHITDLQDADFLIAGVRLTLGEHFVLAQGLVLLEYEKTLYYFVHITLLRILRFLTIVAE